ncbi:MAG: cellulose binding domain-containing protein, partial [Umezawaea sp.]
QVLTYTNGATSIATTTGVSGSATLPPYSLTTLTLRPKTSTTPPAAPARPTASAVTDHEATITWAPTGAGVKYEVHRQVGTTTQQWGETTNSSFTVHNLAPGTRYAVNVIARDNAGRVSWSSPPVTFTTATPAASTCAVAFADVNDWGNGYVGSVDITNTGTTPVDTWTLTFEWPTTWQQVSSGWSGTWTQTGTTVQVTSNADNRVIAPGATTNTGFVGAYQGPNAPPATFRLNGTLCTTR